MPHGTAAAHTTPNHLDNEIGSGLANGHSVLLRWCPDLQTTQQQETHASEREQDSVLPDRGYDYIYDIITWRLHSG